MRDAVPPERRFVPFSFPFSSVSSSVRLSALCGKGFVFSPRAEAPMETADPAVTSITNNREYRHDLDLPDL